MKKLVRFLHPFARRPVTRVLCPSHRMTAIGMLQRVEVSSDIARPCDWCEALTHGEALRERVAREINPPLSLVQAGAR